MELIFSILFVFVASFMALIITLRAGIAMIGSALKIEKYPLLAKLFNFLRSITVLTLIIILIGFHAYEIYEANWYKRFLPEELEISDTVLISGHADLANACGVAIFKLTDSLNSRFSEEGINVLKSALKSRDRVYDSEYRNFEKWQRTPMPPDDSNRHDRWKQGLFCANMGEKLGPAIMKEVQEDRSYYTDGILVLPGLGLVVFSYND